MHFRYARHTSDISKLEDFYATVLNLDILAGFQDHDGYNGVFLGPKGGSWHLEFTESSDVPDHTFDEEDNLVFYPEDRTAYDRILEQIQLQKIPLVPPRNPYWVAHGIMILDPDGFRVVISNDRLNS
ncbi:MAG: VOC family protein [Saprospiraceae bacterium]|nr:VOC family protein [Saprospiraceae bacterium]